MSEKSIIDYLTPEEILAGLAEEFAEGAQAALKLRRALDGTNPTPKSVEECSKNLQEEVADVLLCLGTYLAATGVDVEKYYDDGGICKIMERKCARWLRRLMEKEAADGKA